MAGLSLALGAFIAGMLISETEYKHQVETDIRPVPRRAAGPVLHQHRHAAGLAPGARALAAGAAAGHLPVLFKAVLVTVLASGLGSTSLGHFAMRTGLYLAQAGEFGFVLLTLAQKRPGSAGAAQPDPGEHGAVDAGHALHHHVQQPHRDEAGLQRLAAAVAADDHHRAQVDQFQQARDHLRLRPLRPEPGAHARRRGHPYMALDLDPDRVRQAAAAGDSVVFGDAARLQALMAAGLARASAVVVTYVTRPSALKVLAMRAPMRPRCR
jgi:CPA2 family monovalent cation:H+ antiporter-2